MENIDYDDTLFRVGRSTIVDSHMTSGPQEGQHTDTYITATTSMDSMEEETTQRMATNEQQETFMTDESIVTEPTTIDLFKDTTTESIVENKENDDVPFQPFLLRSGKKKKVFLKTDIKTIFFRDSDLKMN